MNTPETDKRVWSDHSEGILCEVVEASFARRLERERDEAREKAERYRLDANAMMLQRDEARNLACVYQHQYYMHVHPNAAVPYFSWEKGPNQ
jgi:hypothetical protein